MNIQIAKIISLVSITLLGVLIILSVWGIIRFEEVTAKIVASLGVIFVVSAVVSELYRKDSGKK